MAERPVFLPNYEQGSLVYERTFNFKWASGFAEIQKKKNIYALHAEAEKQGVEKILEISSKSDNATGRHLSAFSLKIDLDDGAYPLESVYQGSKVFEDSGPHSDIFEYTPRDAKKFIRNLNNTKLIGFQLQGVNYPTSPKSAFYDWLYIRSLKDYAAWIKDNVFYEAFTDIEFNPSKQVNCQARAFAEYLSLIEKGQLEKAVKNFDYFAYLLNPIQ